MFNDGVFEGDAIGANEVGIDDEIIFGFEVASGHGGVPDFFGISGFATHASDNSSDDDAYDEDYTKNSEKFVHFDSFLVRGLA